MAYDDYYDGIKYGYGKYKNHENNIFYDRK